MYDPKLRSRRAAGFSLIEVLVALVVLTIGIFAILRLFPGGFLTILRTSELTQAQGLAQQQVDAQKQLASVADSVVALNPAFDASMPINPVSNPYVLADVNPDTLDDASTASAMNNKDRYVDPYYISNVNHFLHVMGENFRISVPTSNSAQGDGAIYMLQLGPVYNVFGTDAQGNPADSLVVRGQPIQRTEQSSDTSFNNPTGSPILLNDGQYAIDYNNLKIAFYPRLGTGKRQFVFAYEYLKNVNNNIQVVPVVPDPANPQNTTITVPDVAPASLPPGQTTPQPIWQSIFASPTDLNGVVKPMDFDQTLKLHVNAEEVSRKFRLVQTGTGAKPAFDNDPYEYAWYSEQFSTNANAGVLLFNPAGYNQVIASSRGNQPLTARVDYTIFDNHIIREDRVLPSAPPYDLRLSLQFIRLNGNVGDNTRIYDTLTTYNGMFRDFNGNTPDLLIYDVNTGEKISQLQASSVTGIVGLSLDDRTGVVRLNQANVESNNLQGASIRIFYRTEKEWGTQLLKANAHYTQADQPINVQFDSFYLGGSDAAKDGSPNRIYFPVCEAGKTVVLGEYFVQTNLAAPDNKRRFDNEAYQINSEPALFETIGGRTLTWVDIATQHPESTAQSWVWDPYQTGRAVSNLRGGSLRARVVWRDAGRWRHVDNHTFLSQPSNR